MLDSWPGPRAHGREAEAATPASARAAYQSLQSSSVHQMPSSRHDAKPGPASGCWPSTASAAGV
eukprot:12450593-Heterocapsa_arctica.AAC.1